MGVAVIDLEPGEEIVGGGDGYLLARGRRAHGKLRFQARDATTGDVLSGWCSHQWEAHDRAEFKLRLRRRRERKCITCPTVFLSEGPHHRMCDRCRRSETE